ncbi:tetratricopeptide repeat protein [Paraburkholderia sp. CNPSo 3157]|uniref:protein O-GlcNAc transferase n=1 Tax=Paraburkholderia franconis TaxID=2654983 RepID=A0A7X1NBP4_9BURK|nr:tetratricopeptide repeat protein [Paraburkholderia franconis]MPW18621.1 tetratricopeptide repeat protein [Paraburkholderia franconis]
MSEFKFADLGGETTDELLSRADALCRSDRLDEADELCREVLAIDPAHAGALHLRGMVAYRSGEHARAADLIMEAISRDPKPDYYFALGNVMAAHRRVAAAAECFRLVTQMQPEHADAYNNLGIAQRGLKRYHDAVQSFCKVLELQPGNGRAYNNLANVLLSLDELPAALEAWQIAMELAPAELEPRSNRLTALNYAAGTTPEQYLDEARKFAQVVEEAAQPFRSWLVGMAPRTERPLRVGVVSGDLRRHPVAYFLENVVKSLDTARVELVAYQTSRDEDELTVRLKPYFHSWQSIAGIRDFAAAQQIRNDKIDVLIDASGHTTYNRLALFAWKPAPVQVCWPGYFASTGLKAIDYLLGDRHVLPQGEEHHFVEKPWRLPDSYLCFTPPDVAPAVGPLPVLKNGFVTFGYFGRLTKMTDVVVATWAAILRRVPGSRLLLKAAQLDFDDIRVTTLKRFLMHGIGAEQLLLEGFSARGDYLDAYNRVDIALSPFPYSSGTTAAESLWMGVPVFGMQGDRFVSHIVESIVHAAGLGDTWIARSRDDYIERAVAFAANPQALGELRAGLRAHVLASPLCDAPRFARHLEDALHAMWDENLAQRLQTKHEAS